MRRPLSALSLSLVLATGAAKAFAAPADMALEIYDSQRIGLYGNAASVIVGNPDIADVTMLDAHSLVISGKGFGATRVQAFDSNGRELFSKRVVIVAPQNNQVTVYRGAEGMEYNCSPKCHGLRVTETNGQPANTGAGMPAPASAEPSPGGKTTTTMTISQTTEAAH